MSTNLISVCVVLPAAGCGNRMKMSIPKQFVDVNGRPLICYAIQCFERLSYVKKIVVATCPDKFDLLDRLVHQRRYSKVVTVAGGTTRHRSIYAALQVLRPESADIDVIVIHDAVRPFVAGRLIDQIVQDAQVHGASGVRLPLISTVIACDSEGHLTESLDRSRYVNSEMPQAFQPSIILNAYDKCTEEDLEHGTECLLLTMKYGGVRAHIVEGTGDLWKVTYKRDIPAAEATVKERFLRFGLNNGQLYPRLEACIVQGLRAANYQVSCLSDRESPLPDELSLPSDAEMENSVIFMHDCEDGNCNPDYAKRTQKNIDTSVMKNIGSCLAASGESFHRIISHGAGDVLDHNSPCSLLTQRLLSAHESATSSVSNTSSTSVPYIHVFVVNEESNVARYMGVLSVALRKLSQLVKCDAVVHGVLTHKCVTGLKLGEMVASVIQRSHPTFSGQLFIVT